MLHRPDVPTSTNGEVEITAVERGATTCRAALSRVQGFEAGVEILTAAGASKSFSAAASVFDGKFLAESRRAADFNAASGGLAGASVVDFRAATGCLAVDVGSALAAGVPSVRGISGA